MAFQKLLILPILEIKYLTMQCQHYLQEVSSLFFTFQTRSPSLISQNKATHLAPSLVSLKCKNLIPPANTCLHTAPHSQLLPSSRHVSGFVWCTLHRYTAYLQAVFFMKNHSGTGQGPTFLVIYLKYFSNPLH